MSVRHPCPTCPWRVDQDATVIPNFSLDLAEGLACTTSQEFGAPQFACHQSREDREIVCAGWLARYGWDNIGVRFGLLTGKYTPEMLEPGDDWPETHETFEDVITKLRLTAPTDDEEVTTVKFLRTSIWTAQAVEDGSPFTVIVPEDDLTVDYEEYKRLALTGALGVPRGEAFFGFDCFERDGDDLATATLHASSRFDPEGERQQAVTYHWNASMLSSARAVLTNTGPTKLTVEQTEEVLVQVAEHPDYHGQLVQCYVWKAPNEGMDLVEMKDGRTTTQRGVTT